MSLYDIWNNQQERLRNIYQEQLSRGNVPGIYKSICLECGREIYNRTRPQKFCSTREVLPYCSERYNQRRYREARRAARENTICLNCGKVFTPKTAKAKYCSTACKQQAYRKRTKENTEN